MMNRVKNSLILLLTVAAVGLAVVLIVTRSPSSVAPSLQPGTSLSLESAVRWDRAQEHIGKRVTIYGPVVSTHQASGSKGRPTFLNIGADYPDTRRLQVVIWEQNLNKFGTPPKTYYHNKTVYVYGLITSYNGVAQVEVSEPSQIRIRE